MNVDRFHKWIEKLKVKISQCHENVKSLVFNYNQKKILDFNVYKKFTKVKIKSMPCKCKIPGV